MIARGETQAVGAFSRRSAALAIAAPLLRPRGLHWSTIARLARQSLQAEKGAAVRAFICVADHYEPMWNRPAKSVQLQRVERWHHAYPESVAGLTDCRGRPPQHTFFYPAEEYAAEYLDPLADLTRRGLGDVEVHLHHDDATADQLREQLLNFTETLYERHGLLFKDGAGRISYGFIHGNWALDNSRPDGRLCGVNNELTVLRETGCYADFTMPSAPELAQTRTINSIYYAVDDPTSPKSHDHGTPAGVEAAPPADSLLLIQGPLALDLRRRKWGILPKLENGDLHGGRPPTIERLGLWLQANISVAGRPDWKFIKLHTHGAQEKNSEMLLGDPMRRFHEALAAHTAGAEGFEYYYVTAREMAALVHQAERGLAEPDWEALGCPRTTA